VLQHLQHHYLSLGAVAMLALSACAADAVDAEGEPPPLFGPDHIVAVEIELAADDWESLRTQTRSWIEIYDSCLAEPFASPFSYVPATVTIDGARFEQVGVRKRGFLGSLSTDKPSLRIALDEYVAGQALPGATDLLLNNAVQDPSYVRQCLAYRTFAAAGLPAPRCNFARVRVNGDDLGLYVNVEPVDDDFVARHFEASGGNLYEGTYSDFRAGWLATFELETDGAAGDRRDLDAVALALERPDGELLDAVAAVVDVDRFLTFWAAEVLVGQRDGFTGNANNFFAYHDPAGDRFHFIPWGADGTFLPGPDPLGSGAVSVTAGSALPWRLYQLPVGRDRYVARLRALLDEVWDEQALEAEIDRMQALIEPVVDPGGDGGLAANLAEVRGFVRGRRAAILGELDAGPPEWDTPLPEPPCFEVIGEVSGTLQTSWGTAGGDALASGDGTVAATVDGVPLDVVAVGSTAGLDPADPARAQLLVVATLADGSAALVVLQLDPARLVPGTSLSIDWLSAEAIVYRYDPTTGTLAVLGLMPGGTIDLVEVATDDGATVRASFHGRVVLPP
jgi:hypothetical protein